MAEEYNLKTAVESLYVLSIAENITDGETGKELTVAEFQDIMYQQVEQLADLLGIDLEERSK